MDILHYYTFNAKEIFLYDIIIPSNSMEVLLMDEIEVKVLGINVDEIRDRVIILGGKLVKKEMQENHIYHFPPHVENQNGYIRIRTIHNQIDDTHKNILTSKKIISQGKYRKTEEQEVLVSDLQSCQNFLNALELKFYKQQNKYRESYELSGALIEIDEWDKDIFPEPYIEIEAEHEDKLFEVLKMLEIPEEKVTSKTLEQLKEEMGIK
jgi:adenylate cyclase, class 2